MSGHSKWHNIQKKKGAADAKRGAVFTKLSKAITIAAKNGGGDPNFNFSLRVAIDNAKVANMPKDKIQKAIDRGTGEGGAAELVEVIYEGFGPGGAAMLIQCLTDNRNRTVAEVKTIMSKNGGNVGNGGSVMWMFDKKGVVAFADTSVQDRDAFELAMIDAGAEDIQWDEGGVQIVSKVEDLKSVVDNVEALGITPDVAGIEYLPNQTVEIVGAEEKEKLEKLVDLLDEYDDVDAIFTNED